MKRAVVTGGAGFLGSHLCDGLIEGGYEVVCFDNFLTGTPGNIRHLTEKPKFSFIEHNVTECLRLEGKVDVVLHFASPASPRDYLQMPIETLQVGSLGTNNALDLARVNGAKFLFASSSEVYGDPLISPQAEHYWGNVNSIGPRSVYDEAKRFSEALTVAYRQYHGVDTRIARIFNTYGPRMRPDDGRAVSNFIVQALRGEPLTIFGTGSQTRSFCYVSDLVEGIMRLVEAPRSEEIGIPFNLGNPEERTIRDLANRVLELTGSPSAIENLSLPEDDPKIRCPNIERASKHLDWFPSVKINEGLSHTIESFRSVLADLSA